MNDVKEFNETSIWQEEYVIRLCHVLNHRIGLTHDDLEFITNKITLEEYKERTGYGKD